MLTLVPATPKTLTIPPNPLFDMTDLAELADADMYLHMPTGIEHLHPNLCGRKLHARCGLKLVYYASRLIYQYGDYMEAAENEEAMLRHRNVTDQQRLGRLKAATQMRQQARNLHNRAGAIYQAIGKAVIIESPT